MLAGGRSVSWLESPCTALLLGDEAANLSDKADAVDGAGTLEAIGVVAAVDPTDPAEESLGAASIEGIDVKDVFERRLAPGKHPAELAGVFFTVVEYLFKNRPQAGHRKHPHV